MAEFCASVAPLTRREMPSAPIRIASEPFLRPTIGATHLAQVLAPTDAGAAVSALPMWGQTNTNHKQPPAV